MSKTILEPVAIGCNSDFHGLFAERYDNLNKGIPSTFGAVGE
jgi:hypothetical protein